MRRRWQDGHGWGRLATSSVGSCHYYELGNYITVCKPGQDLRRKKEAGLGTIDIMIYRHGPSVDMPTAHEKVVISSSLAACHGR
jgi:hypothetical protein